LSLKLSFFHSLWTLSVILRNIFDTSLIIREELVKNILNKVMYDIF
jgi:hypothetical protein